MESLGYLLVLGQALYEHLRWVQGGVTHSLSVSIILIIVVERTIVLIDRLLVSVVREKERRVVGVKSYG